MVSAEQRRRRKIMRGVVIQVHGTRCPICGRSGATDVHEVIVTRGMLPGRPGDLTDPRNCVVVHSGECHRKAQHSAEGKRACCDKILSMFSVEDVKEFVDGLGMKNPPNVRSICNG